MYRNLFLYTLGLQPVNPPKTNQQSAAKKIVDFDRTKDKEEEKEEVFGLRTDIYGDKKGIKVEFIICVINT